MNYFVIEPAKFIFNKDEYNLEFTKSQITELACFLIRLNKEAERYYSQHNRKEIKLISASGRYMFSINNEQNILISLDNNIIIFQRNELELLTTEAYKIVKKLYWKYDIALHCIDAIFLEHMLFIDLPFLRNIEIEECNLYDLKIFSHNIVGGINITASEYYRVLKGDINSISMKSKSNMINQTDNERLVSVLECMKKNAYGQDNRLIVVYNNESIIRDGAHRAACLAYLYGDIKVKIMRMQFEKNYYSYSVYMKENLW